MVGKQPEGRCREGEHGKLPGLDEQDIARQDHIPVIDRQVGNPGNQGCGQEQEQRQVQVGREYANPALKNEHARQPHRAQGHHQHHCQDDLTLSARIDGIGDRCRGKYQGTQTNAHIPQREYGENEQQEGHQNQAGLLSRTQDGHAGQAEGHVG